MGRAVAPFFGGAVREEPPRRAPRARVGPGLVPGLKISACGKTAPTGHKKASNAENMGRAVAPFFGGAVREEPPRRAPRARVGPGLVPGLKISACGKTAPTGHPFPPLFHAFPRKLSHDIHQCVEVIHFAILHVVSGELLKEFFCACDFDFLEATQIHA